MQYRRGTTSGDAPYLPLSADFSVLLLALDRMIGEGDREIARLEKRLADISRGERETASGAKGQVRLFEATEGATGRRPDLVVPFCADDRAMRRRAA